MFQPLHQHDFFPNCLNYVPPGVCCSAALRRTQPLAKLSTSPSTSLVPFATSLLPYHAANEGTTHQRLWDLMKKWGDKVTEVTAIGEGGTCSTTRSELQNTKCWDLRKFIIEGARYSSSYCSGKELQNSSHRTDLKNELYLGLSSPLPLKLICRASFCPLRGPQGCG